MSRHREARLGADDPEKGERRQPQPAPPNQHEQGPA